MPTSIHGHEVLKLMLASGKSYTKASLQAELLATFGAAARFHTCSAENLTAAALIDFLDGRGKFVADENGFQTDAAKICNG